MHLLEKKGCRVFKDPSLTDEEFSKRFFACSTDLEKVKLAICHERYEIWTRWDKPNFPEEYLRAIQDLSERHPIKRMRGGFFKLGYLKFDYRAKVAGREIRVFVKGYFERNGTLVVGFQVESLRDDHI